MVNAAVGDDKDVLAGVSGLEFVEEGVDAGEKVADGFDVEAGIGIIEVERIVPEVEVGRVAAAFAEAVVGEDR